MSQGNLIDAMQKQLLSGALISLAIIIGAVTFGVFGLSSLIPGYLQSPVQSNSNGQGGATVTVDQAQPNGGYLPPGAPPTQTIISTTTVSISVPLSTVIEDNISQSDPASPVTNIVLNTTTPITYVELEIYQLSSLPFGVPSPSGTTFLILQFVLQSNLDQEIQSVIIEFKMPANATQQDTAIQKAGSASTSSSVFPSSLILQRNDGRGSWMTLPTKIVGSDGQHAFFRAQSTSLSLFALTTGSNSSHPFSLTFWSTTSIVVIAFLVAAMLLTRHRESKREQIIVPVSHNIDQEENTPSHRETARNLLEAAIVIVNRSWL